MDLTLVPMDELIKEIERRTTCFVMAYETPESKEKDAEFFTQYGHGTYLKAAGLSSCLQNDVMNNWNNE